MRQVAAGAAERVTGITGKGARNALINELIRDQFARYGTPAERELVALADAEIEVRKKARGWKTNARR